MEQSIHDLMEIYKNDPSMLYRLSFLQFRDVEFPCDGCGGMGIKCYGNTATWRHGIGGQALTNDVCDICWGTGDKYKKGANLRELYRKIRELEREVEKLNERK